MRMEVIFGGSMTKISHTHNVNTLKVTNLLPVTFIYQILISWWNIGPHDFHKNDQEEMFSNCCLFTGK